MLCPHGQNHPDWAMEHLPLYLEGKKLLLHQERQDRALVRSWVEQLDQIKIQNELSTTQSLTPQTLHRTNLWSRKRRCRICQKLLGAKSIQGVSVGAKNLQIPIFSNRWQGQYRQSWLSFDEIKNWSSDLILFSTNELQAILDHLDPASRCQIWPSQGLRKSERNQIF